MKPRLIIACVLAIGLLPGCSTDAHEAPRDPDSTAATLGVTEAIGAPQPGAAGAVSRTVIGEENTGEVANSVIELDDGGFLVAGYQYRDLRNDSEWDALVMRISPDGEEVWRNSSHDDGSEYAWVVRESPDGWFAVVGSWEAENGAMDGYMQGFDADGNALWMRSYGGEDEDVLWAAEPMPEGGFLLTGETDSDGAGGLDFFVVRTTPDGEEMWSRAYGTPVTDRAFGLDVTPDGGALIAGFTGADEASMNLLLVRIDDEGRELWRRTIAGDRFDVAHDVLRLDDGGFAVSGYTSSLGPGDHDGFLMRLTESGRMLWMKTYDRDNGDDRILHVDQLDDGGFAMVGYTNGDVMVWRVDGTGDVLWWHADGGSSTDFGKDIQVTREGSIVAVGGNRSDNPPFDDVLLLVLDE